MRILAVSHSCVVDLNQRVFRELERRGHHVGIIVPSNWHHVWARDGVQPARLDGFNGQLIARPVWNSGSVPLHAYRARPAEILARFKPDVMYIEEDPYTVAAFQWAIAAGRRRIPALFHAKQNIVRRHSWPVRQIERTVWRSTDGAIAISEEASSALRQRGYFGKVHVVPYSVDLSLFRAQPRDLRLQATLGLRSRVVAYVGKMVFRKGVTVLLEAYEKLQHRAETTLLLVGSGPLEDAFRDRDGVVVASGVAHAEVPRYLSLADVLVVPSLITPTWKQQFGRVVIEALACGVPVVGSSSGEIPHLVTRTGGGIVVTQGESLPLTHALDTLLGDEPLRQRFAEQGRSVVEAHYGTGPVADELETFLGDAVAGRMQSVFAGAVNSR